MWTFNFPIILVIQSEALWVNLCVFTDYKEAFPAPVHLYEASEEARRFIMVSNVYRWFWVSVLSRIIAFLLSSVMWRLWWQHWSVAASPEPESAASLPGCEEHAAALWWTCSEPASDPTAGPRKLPPHAPFHLRTQVCLKQISLCVSFTYTEFLNAQFDCVCLAWQPTVICSKLWLRQVEEHMNFLTPRRSTLGQRRWITLFILLFFND